MKNHKFMEKSIRTSWLFNLVSAFLAFMLWGSWAYYINSANSAQSGIISALTQGTASFMITFVMVRAVTYLYHYFQNPVTKIVLPAIVVVSFTSVLLVNVHTLMGTPRVFYTILPGLTVAFCFCLLTSFKLLKIQQQRCKQYE
ncbi:hypothetical protein [uncultured Gimesia sp.]|uniref:hypothetical protein n=1 Tax=uncultured Gimesia sp. TaxID=1678688 RepID=UPI00261FB54C|nr:hypothetical protein [uncultured Gimesia sp.]